MPRIPLIFALAASLGVAQTEPNRLALRTQRSQRVQKTAELLQRERPGGGFTAEDTFQPLAAFDDSLGRTHVRFRRFYKGVRVYKGDVKVTLNREGDGAQLIRSDMRVVALTSVRPLLSEAQAKAVAGAGLPAGRFKTELVVYTGDERASSARLVWVVKGTDGIERLIDAISGTEIARRAFVRTDGGLSIATGTGYTRSGTVPITNAFSNSEGEYLLTDITRGGLSIYDLENKAPSDGWKGRLYQWNPNNWGQLNGDWEPGDSTWTAVGQTAAVEAYYAARASYDMLWSVFSRKSLDDADGPMKLRVHARKDTDDPYGDANWDNEYANFGDGDVGDSSRTTLMTVGHELGHGFFQFAIGEDTSTGEASGINEGHGDIMGALVKMYTALTDQQGPGIPTPPKADGYFHDRSLRPWNYHSSDGSQGLPAYVSDMGDKEEHTQGCAYGRMFAMLVMGAPATYVSLEETPLHTAYLPKGMKGIGADKAAQIWYLATAAKFDSNPNFFEARDAWLEAAADLFGPNSPEYRAVNNAFAGINIGSYIADATRPTVGVEVAVDDAGQNVYVEATAVDDLGVSMEIRVGSDLVKTVIGTEYRGYIDLGKAPTGPKSLRVKVCDVIACVEAIQGFAYQGADHLLKNGLFESGESDWQINKVQFPDNQYRAFLGRRFAEFGSGATIRQTATVPQGITSLKLGFRVAVNSTIAPVGEESFVVEILDEDLNLLQNVQQLDASGLHTYEPYVHDLPGYAGKKIVVRFRSSGQAFPGRFKLDNVYLVYKAPPRADFTVTVDENEGSVHFAVKDITGIGMHQVDAIEFGSSAIPTIRVPVSQNQWLQAFTPTSNYTVGTIYGVTATLRTWSGEKYVLGNRLFTVKAIPQLIRNGGFEQTKNWEYKGNGGYAASSGELQAYSFLGTRFFWLGGEMNAKAELKQWINLPPAIVSATLTFRLCIVSQNKSGLDTLTVRVVDKETEKVLGTLGQYSNAVSTGGEGTHQGYKKFTKSLLAYAGKLIYISFEASEDVSHPTQFRIDNVGVTFK